MANILIADDEKEIVHLLKIYIEANDNKVFEAYDGEAALRIYDSEDIDLAIVDIMMPKLDGYGLIKHIRKNSLMPILVISAKIQLTDRILGIDLGADDYITKPFEPLEVAAKVRAHLRRLKGNLHKDNSEIDADRVIVVGDIELDLNQCTVKKGVEIFELTKVEYKVLELLMSQPKRVFTKEQIFEYAWDEDYVVDDNSIRVIISRIRDKIGNETIKTIRGLGYRFDV